MLPLAVIEFGEGIGRTIIILRLVPLLIAQFEFSLPIANFLHFQK